METKEEVTKIEKTLTSLPHKQPHDIETAPIVPLQQEARENDIHINLTWRSWLVVFVTCFA